MDYSVSTFVSIIIPVRNEANNIKACIESLLKQNYPSQLFEIIVVDDQSYDETPDILIEIEDPKLKLMRLGVEGMTTIKGSKKKAISYGVNHARGKLIVTTDGDCVLPSLWIRSIAQYYEQYNPKLIVGPVTVHNNKGLMHAFESLDLMSGFLVNSAGISSGINYLCSGANLAYEKEIFLKLNPYESNMHIYSGDDVFLIKKFQKVFRSEIHSLKCYDSICKTKGVRSWRELMEQRIRWASKMKLTGSISAMFLATTVWLQKICPWILLGISVLSGFQKGIFLFGGILLLQYLIDFIVLYKASGFFRERKLLSFFLPLEILHTKYYFLLGILSWLPIPLYWKDRKI
ncbi:MAG: glycosyltransferase [Saprospiraceae bacterium]|nr:glycosyltransferase [Saprospiraceae bacterium]